MFLPFSWILGPEWMLFDSIDCFLRGLVGACGVSVMCSLMRVYNFIEKCSDSETENEGNLRSSSVSRERSWRAALQFWSLAVLLSMVGLRVSSLIVLEFSLRAISVWASAGMDASGRGVDLLLVQCQFSLGCCLTSILIFLHEGAPHSSLSLFLAAALSWALASCSHSLWSHVARLFPLHSTERYCGKCITLLTSGHTILAALQRAVVLVFALATVASTTMVYDHFLSQRDALKFCTPLALCYTLLVFSIQGDQPQLKGTETVFHTVVVRFGALLVLMMTVGSWSDVLHVLIAFLGEALCLLPSQDLLQAVLKEEEETSSIKYEESSGHKRRKSSSPHES
ncbi:transmembrane protein 82-like [Parambassis ranga]|uniref:Transmembrane protein 82-like n=1 Tax=Parambassis ranga TaxID=210632 RepID=A0A6P7I4X7_9TELE|nr:transmembrane protein 82-like [Parambassis ranga]